MKTYFAKDVCYIIKNKSVSKTPEHYENLSISYALSHGFVYLGFIGEYSGCQTLSNFECKRHGTFAVRVKNLNHAKHGCPNCALENRAEKRKLSIEKIYNDINRICDENGTIELTEIKGGYKTTKTRNLFFKCKLCNGMFNTSHDHLKRGQACPKCRYKKISVCNTRNQLDIELDIKIECKKRKTVEFVEFENGYCRYKSKNLIMRCLRGHGNYTTTANDFFKGCGCPTCGGTKRLTEKQASEQMIKECEIRGYDFLGFFNGYKKSAEPNAKLKCKRSGVVFYTSHNNFMKGQNCKCCSEFGYRTTKSGVFYVQKLLENNIFCGVKFGVTNRTTKERIGGQSRLSKFDHEIFYELTLQDGQKILDLENKIKEAMKGKTSYISKEDMPDGYTETVAPSELSTIMYIVKSFEKELTK